MGNNLETLKKIWGALTIIFAIIFVIALTSSNSMSYNDPSFDIAYNLMWVGLGGTPLFAILWFVFKVKADNTFAEENRIKREEQRKIEEAKKEQQKVI